MLTKHLVRVGVHAVVGLLDGHTVLDNGDVFVAGAASVAVVNGVTAWRTSSITVSSFSNSRFA